MWLMDAGYNIIEGEPFARVMHEMIMVKLQAINLINKLRNTYSKFDVVTKLAYAWLMER